ncbi:MAG: hypothetical protein P4L71_01845 [Acetobacteraceae bacterium]|nr:hypothetical protein [Acetobacteraceae bacterium]
MQLLLTIVLILSPFLFLFFLWSGLALLGSVFCFFMWLCTHQYVFLRAFGIMIECGIPPMLIAGLVGFVGGELTARRQRRGVIQ